MGGGQRAWGKTQEVIMHDDDDKAQDDDDDGGDDDALYKDGDDDQEEEQMVSDGGGQGSPRHIPGGQVRRPRAATNRSATLHHPCHA